ncbi:MAG TPA: hypothetical protein VJ831_01205, partial [Jatrophihabitantaceae bacterium]|nr:hypothetical protein [Jatrophihabitantaceae bacterium]
MIRRCSRVLAALVLMLAGFVATTSAPANATAPVFTDAAGIHVVSVQQIDDRLWALSVSSPALGRAVRLRVLLPTGYDADSATRHPVLYLFHGTSGGP